MLPRLTFQVGFVKAEKAEGDIPVSNLAFNVQQITTTIVLGYAAIVILRIIEARLTKNIS